MIPMTLGQVAGALGAECEAGARDVVVRRIATDSRDIVCGDLFFAIRGPNFDGHDFVHQAIAKGAVAAVVEGEWRTPTSERGGPPDTDHRAVAHGDTWIALNNFSIPPINQDLELPLPDGRGTDTTAHRAVAHGDHRSPTAERGGPRDQIHADTLITLKVADTVAALGKLAAHYRREVMDAETVVVAVTGSNGKTTTKCMIDHVLGGRLQGRASPKSFNNQFGVPLSILSAEAKDRYLVLEVGTNHPGEIAALASIAWPTVAVITSIGEAHLEGLGSLDGVAAEKTSLLDHVRPGGFAVVNVDREVIWPHLHSRPRLRLMTIGFSPVAGTPVKSISSTLQGTVSELEGRYRLELPMPGAHHATNAAAAFVVGRWFGIPPWEVLERLRTFIPPEGRTRVFKLGMGTVVDDTYNANPASVSAAIDALRRETAGRRVFVLGDMLELGVEAGTHHRDVIRLAASVGIETFVAVGAETVKEALECGAALGGMRVICCDGLESAVRTLAPLVEAGNTIWLKASRGMQLDQVVGRLRASFEVQAAVA